MPELLASLTSARTGVPLAITSTPLTSTFSSTFMATRWPSLAFLLESASVVIT
jgi:hypothetical protein